VRPAHTADVTQIPLSNAGDAIVSRAQSPSSRSYPSFQHCNGRSNFLLVVLWPANQPHVSCARTEILERMAWGASILDRCSRPSPPGGRGAPVRGGLAMHRERPYRSHNPPYSRPYGTRCQAPRDIERPGLKCSRRPGTLVRCARLDDMSSIVTRP
jgi:hypothetical protein